MADAMMCPNCGVAMNHHGDKVLYEEAGAVGGHDSPLGGTVFEFHSCPQCGGTATRAE